MPKNNICFPSSDKEGTKEESGWKSGQTNQPTTPKEAAVHLSFSPDSQGWFLLTTASLVPQTSLNIYFSNHDKGC